jgi:hypothetical protein
VYSLSVCVSVSCMKKRNCSKVGGLRRPFADVNSYAIVILILNRNGDMAPEVTGKEEMKDSSQRSAEVQAALDKLGIQETKPAPKPSFVDSLRMSADFIPRIRRGFGDAEEKEADDVMAVGWKVEIRNRKEREEALRDEVHRFEAKMKKHAHMLDEGRCCYVAVESKCSRCFRR